MSYLKVNNVTKVYGEKKILRNINLEVSEGTFCVILGPSGCGKSTLLNLIAGLDDITEGDIQLAQQDITRVAPHKRDIAMVFQNYALYPHLSVYENIAFGLRVRKEASEEIKKKVERTSAILNIKDKLSRLPRELSGGERQRVATGRAIVRDPKIFLFDEPLSNLDARLRIEMRTEFLKLHKQLQKTILYVTHDQVEAMVLGEMVVVIKDGIIQQISPPRELYSNPHNLFVAEFIGTPPMNILVFTLLKNDHTILLERSDFVYELPPHYNTMLAKYHDQPVYCGIRPAAVKIQRGGDLTGEILFIETLGDDTFAFVRIAEKTEIMVKITENETLQAGEHIPLSINLNHIYFFDSDGVRINPEMRHTP